MVKFVLSRDDLIDVLNDTSILARMSGQATGIRGSVKYLAYLLLLLILLAITIRNLKNVSESLRWLIIVFLAALAPGESFLLIMLNGVHAFDILDPIVISASLWGIHDASFPQSLHTIEKANTGILI
jgi:uncharacterized membrane protein YhaH (DUF805 family)